MIYTLFADSGSTKTDWSLMADGTVAAHIRTKGLNPFQMSEDEMLRLLATDGMLVKRPLLVGDDFVLVGFKESEWAARVKNE